MIPSMKQKLKQHTLYVILNELKSHPPVDQRILTKRKKNS